MRSSDIEQAKTEQIATTGSENSDADAAFMTAKFLQSPAAPLVEASVSVTPTLYAPAGSPF